MSKMLKDYVILISDNETRIVNIKDGNLSYSFDNSSKNYC